MWPDCSAVAFHMAPGQQPPLMRRVTLVTLLLGLVLVPRLQCERTSRDAPRGFALPLHRKTHVPTRGRMLMRNSSFPLHGTVKDLGCAGPREGATASAPPRRYFYATIYIGTPPRKFTVIVDTGSTITYVPCASCGSNCGKHKVELPTGCLAYSRTLCSGRGV